MTTNTPSLKTYIESSIDSRLQKRILYTLKTMAFGQGYSIASAPSPSGCDIHISSGVPTPETEAKVTCIISPSLFSSPHSYRIDRVQRPENGGIAFRSSEEEDAEIFKDVQGKRIFQTDILGQAFHLLVGGHEACYQQEATSNALVRLNVIQEPIIQINSQLLFAPFKESSPPSPLWKGSSFAATLSHDVDYPWFVRWKELAKCLLIDKSVTKIFKTLFMTAPDFWQFPNVMQSELERGFTSAFYFCPTPGSPFNYFKGDYDTFYDIKEERFQLLIKDMMSKGFEVGLHASCAAHRDERDLKREFTEIQQLTSDQIGNRHHCWSLDSSDPNKTLQHHARIGLTYDTSLSESGYVGFRRGTCQPFFPYDLQNDSIIETVQLPPTIMDDYLFSYRANNGIEDYRQAIDSHIATIKQYNGLLVADYHQRMMNDVYYAEERKSYIYLLDKLRESEALVQNPIEHAREYIETTRASFNEI